MRALFALALCAGLAACGGGSSSTPQPIQAVLLPAGNGTGETTCQTNPIVNGESVTNCAGVTVQVPGPAGQCDPGSAQC